MRRPARTPFPSCRRRSGYVQIAFQCPISCNLHRAAMSQKIRRPDMVFLLRSEDRKWECTNVFIGTSDVTAHVGTDVFHIIRFGQRARTTNDGTTSIPPVLAGALMYSQPRHRARSARVAFVGYPDA